MIEPPPKPDEKPTEKKSEREPTPEEQMAAYEEDLKETDWGHQPC